MRIYELLTALYPSKACGQDKIPNWMLEEYAEFLAFSISRIINLSFKRAVSSEDLEVRGRVSSTKDEAA